MVLAVPGTGLLTARMLEPGVLPPPDAIIYAVSAEGTGAAEDVPVEPAENTRAEAELPAEAEASAPALPAEPNRRQAPRSPARPAAGLLLDSADAAPAPSLQSAPPRQASSQRRCVRNPQSVLVESHTLCCAAASRRLRRRGYPCCVGWRRRNRQRPRRRILQRALLPRLLLMRTVRTGRRGATRPRCSWSRLVRRPRRRWLPLRRARQQRRQPLSQPRLHRPHRRRLINRLLPTHPTIGRSLFKLLERWHCAACVRWQLSECGRRVPCRRRWRVPPCDRPGTLTTNTMKSN